MTVRKKIIALLREDEYDAMELSGMLSIREKEVYEHLVHVARSLASKGERLVVSPYRCLACGYAFKERSRFTRPGRCPHCKGTHIRMARYRVE